MMRNMKENDSYPIDTYRTNITDAVLAHEACLVKAEPGAGKTTRIPLYLLDAVKGQILVLEPRRLAARLSAERAAWFLDERCGETVGYRIRQDSKVSPGTRVTFITEGLFVRLLHQDPKLQAVDVVVLDEFHERNIHTDVALALVRHLQATARPDLKLLVMSATLDTEALETYLGNAAVFDAKGSVFPVETENIAAQNESKARTRGWEPGVVQAVVRMINDSRCPGNILVFLTGIGDILKIISLLRKEIPAGRAEVLPLAADLSFQEQRKVFKKTEKRKVIVSTNVAETSLTLPDITGVVDLGLAKIPAFSPWSGIPTLEVRRISRASAVQRAGRAGRTARGVVYRLYSKAEFLAQDPFTPPDILRLDLSHVFLDVMALGLSPEILQWFEPPGDKNLAAAYELLALLGAIDEHSQITGFGKQLAALPLHPRLGAVAVSGAETGCPEDALLAACLISEGFIVRNEITGHEETPCDVSFQLDLLKQPKQFDRFFINKQKAKTVQGLYCSLSKQLGLKRQLPTQRTDQKKIAGCLLRGFPDRLAVKRTVKKARKGGSPLYNFCMGRGGMISERSVLCLDPPDYFIALDATENPKANAAKGTQVWAGSKIDLSMLKADPGGLVRKETVRAFNEKKGTVQVSHDIYYGKLKIETLGGGEVSKDAGGEELAKMLKENWPYPFDDDAPVEEYHARIELLSSNNIWHNCPVFRGDMFDLLLEALCHGKQSLRELEQHPLEQHLLEQLGQEDRETLRRFAPKQLRLDNGKKLNICYESGKAPRAEAFIQDLFGVGSIPVIGGGKVSVRLHLLAPNRRVAQITDDLPRFWKGSYHEVVKDLRRRYPKHYWPERPAGARPVLLKKDAG